MNIEHTHKHTLYIGIYHGKDSEAESQPIAVVDVAINEFQILNVLHIIVAFISYSNKFTVFVGPECMQSGTGNLENYQYILLKCQFPVMFYYFIRSSHKARMRQEIRRIRRILHPHCCQSIQVLDFSSK